MITTETSPAEMKTMGKTSEMKVLGRNIKILSTPDPCSQHLHILVTVHSHPYDKGNYSGFKEKVLCFFIFLDSRDIIRNSWGKSTNEVKVVFVMGSLAEGGLVDEVNNTLRRNIICKNRF
jgi:hypothetical protein